MSGGQAASNVTLRTDLMGMTEELSFDALGLVADQIAVPAYEQEKAGAFPVLPREAVGKVPNTARKSDGSFARGEWEWSQDSYVSREYGFEEPVDLTQALENSKWFDEEVQASKLAVQGMKLGRESRVASALMNTTTFTGATNLKTLSNEWDKAAATPWADIDAVSVILRKKCGMGKKFQSLLLASDNIDTIIRCTEVIDHAKYVSILPTLPMEQKIQWLASYLGVKEIISVQAIYDGANLGVDFDYSHFWSNEFGMLCIRDNSTNSLKARTVAIQPVFSRYAKDYIIESYDEPANKRRVIRAAEHRSVKIRTDYGVLIENMKTTVSAGGV